MTQKDLDQDPFLGIKKFFAKKPEICVGDKGIYQDVLTIDTINDGTHSLKYDIYIKISAKAVYENLIEIEVLDVFTLNSSNTNVQSLIEANIPKYIKPKYIKWEIKK